MTINISPSVSKPLTVNNYTHAITLLKLKQEKYKKYGVPLQERKIFLSFEKEDFSCEAVFDGIIQNALKEKFVSLKADILENQKKMISETIKSIKKENEFSIRTSSICPQTEKTLFLPPSAASFDDELLYDMYLYINESKTPLEYLEQAYTKYLESFMLKVPNLKCSEMNFIQKVTNFCKLKFNKREFGMAVYDGRCLWAEIYVLYRTGFYKELQDVLEQHSDFFDVANNGFTSKFLAFIHSNEYSYSNTLPNEDKFKIYLYNIMNQNIVSDGFVIQTVEDYIFTLLKANKGDTSMLNSEDFTSQNVKFMVNIFKLDKRSIVSSILKSDFSIISKFYLLKELSIRSDNLEVDESTTSLLSEESEVYRKGFDMKSIFLRFLFGIITNLASLENKVRMIEMLKSNREYYELVPEYLLKYNLFELIKNKEYSLDSKLISGVISIIFKTNKRDLLKITEVVDEQIMSCAIEDIVEQSILTSSPISDEVFSGITVVNSRLKDLIRFYKFFFDPCQQTLNKTPLFEINSDLSDYKLVIEHCFPKVVDVIKYSYDREKAKKLFELCGDLSLGEECSKMITGELVMLI